MKTSSKILLLCGILLHLFLGLRVGKQFSALEQERQVARLKSLLTREVNTGTMERFAHDILKEVGRRCFGRRGNELDFRRIFGVVKRKYGIRHAAMGFYDRNDQLIWASSPNSPDFQALSDKMRFDEKRKLGLFPPHWRIDHILQKPHIHGFWKTDMQQIPEVIGGILLVLHSGEVTPLKVISHNLRKLRRRGFQVDLWDSLRSKLIFNTLKMTPKQLQRQMQSAFFVPDFQPVWEKNRLVFIPFQEKVVGIGWVSPGKPIIPLEASLLLMLWLGWVFHAGYGKCVFTLRTFLSFSFGLAAGVPLLLALVFWLYFSQKRIESLLSETFQDMEKTLIQIDDSLSQEVQSRKTYFTGLLPDKVDNEADVKHLLDRLKQEEFSRRFDNFLVFTSEGTSLRDFSDLPQTLRYWFFANKNQKRHEIQKLLNQGRTYSSKDLELLLSGVEYSEDLTRYWSHKTSLEQAEKVKSGLGAITRILIDRYNGTLSLGPVANEKKGALAMGAAMDSQTGDLIQLAYSSLGKMVKLEIEPFASYSFFELLKNSQGKATHGLIAMQDMRTLYSEFWRKFFSFHAPKLRAYKFFADSSLGIISFPTTREKTAFPEIQHLLAPPRRVFSSVYKTAKGKILVSALACRQVGSYFLVGVKSWKPIRDKEQGLLLSLGLILGFMGFLIWGIVQRLFWGIILPTQALLTGIAAMERKDFEHRIPLSNGDEWDEIAQAFNAALVSMEEMEVAALIQTRLLPSGPIHTPAAIFQGQNHMTSKVGGDYFDAFVSEDQNLFFAIGDVTGHGVSAALVVGMAKAAFQMFFHLGVRSPQEMMTHINKRFYRQFHNKIHMTFQIGCLKPDGLLLLCNAGHPFPFVLTSTRNLIPKKFPSPPLGFREKTCFKEVSWQMNPGDTLFLYSDGIFEQTDPFGECYGFARFETSLRKIFGKAPLGMMETVQRDLSDFSGAAAWGDDVTMAVLQLKAIPDC
ncbi:MAG: SpoIIE family protein phosphatase [Candidatus Ozemobacteraceae bacterium]